MEIYWKWRVFGLNVYVSSRRMKRRSLKDDLRRNCRSRVLVMKHRLYVTVGGRCSMCGRKFTEDELEVHHVAGVGERPDLVAEWKNLRLLCPECHMRLHGAVK